MSRRFRESFPATLDVPPTLLAGGSFVALRLVAFGTKRT